MARKFDHAFICLAVSINSHWPFCLRRLGRYCVELHYGDILKTLPLLFFGYYEITKETGSKSPIVHFD